MKLPTGSSSGNGYYGHETAAVIFIEPQSPIHNDEAPAISTDFSEYLWMEHEEEFDKQVLKQLEEEALMEQCIEAMLEDEQCGNGTSWVMNGSGSGCRSSENNGAAPDLCQGMRSLRVQEEVVNKSTLNPDAAEFVPNFAPASGAGSTALTTSAITTAPDSKSLSDS